MVVFKKSEKPGFGRVIGITMKWLHNLVLTAGMLLGTSSVYAQGSQDHQTEKSQNSDYNIELKEQTQVRLSMPLKISINTWFPESSGRIQATEHQVHTGKTLEGTLLDLKEDFDIGKGMALNFLVGYALSEKDIIIGQVFYENSLWSNVLSKDIMFNERPLKEGTKVYSEIHHFRATLGYDRHISLINKMLECSIGGGWTIDRTSLKLKYYDRENKDSKKKGEDFTDEIIPSIRAGLLIRPDEWLEVRLSVDHGINALGIAFSEKTKYTSVELRTSIKPSDGINLGIGYRFDWLRSDYHGREHDSQGNIGENRFSLRQRGIMMHLGFIF